MSEDKIDFEASLKELESLVKEMESGELTLDESLQKYERGVQLTKQCQEALSKAEARIKAVMGESDEDEPH